MSKQQERYDAIAARLKPDPTTAPQGHAIPQRTIAPVEKKFIALSTSVRGDTGKTVDLATFIELYTDLMDAVKQHPDPENCGISGKLRAVIEEAVEINRRDIVHFLLEHDKTLAPTALRAAHAAGNAVIMKDMLENYLADQHEKLEELRPPNYVSEKHIDTLNLARDYGLKFTNNFNSTLYQAHHGPRAVELFETVHSIWKTQYPDTIAPPFKTRIIPATAARTENSFSALKEQPFAYIQKAVKGGSIELFDYLCHKYNLDISTAPPDFFNQVPYRNQRATLQHLLEKGVLLEKGRGGLLAKICDDDKNTEAIEWLLENGIYTQDALNTALANAVFLRNYFQENNGDTFHIAKLLARYGARMDLTAAWEKNKNLGSRPHHDAMQLITVLQKDCGIDIKAHADSMLDILLHMRRQTTYRQEDSSVHDATMRHILDLNPALAQGRQNALVTAINHYDEPGLRLLLESGLFTEAAAVVAMESIFNSPHNVLKMIGPLYDHGITPDKLSAPAMRDTLSRYAAWRKKSPDVPEFFSRRSPHYFRPLAYDDIRAMLRKEGYLEHPYEAIGMQFVVHDTAALFKTTDRVLDYLDRWGVPGKQPLHDAVQMIQLPQQGRFNLTAWADAVLRHGPKMARLVKFADKLPEPEKDPRGQWSYAKTLDIVARNAYQRGAEYPQLARLCFTAKMTEKQFETVLATIDRYREKPAHRIPDITISGEIFDKPGYNFYKLNDGDPRGLLLGEFTDCCQHIGGAGAECAKHGFLSPEAGFYVIADSKNDKIVAQSWAWRGKNDELVLDSLESLRGHMEAGQWQKLIGVFANAAQNHTASKISTLHIGKGGATPTLDYPAETPATPADYTGYRDSNAQYKIGAPA